MRGLAIGVLAVGVILIYRSCRVINFALGELGALAAALFVRLVVNWHWNFYLALALTVAAGALVGALMELGLVRRLSAAPRVVLMVASTGEIGPGMLLRTFAAAVIGGMVSLPLAVVAAVVIGVVESVLFFNNS